MDENAKLYRNCNYKLCTSIDITSLGVVLNEMVERGHISEEDAKLYREQAENLLTLLRNINDRGFDKIPIPFDWEEATKRSVKDHKQRS